MCALERLTVTPPVGAGPEIVAVPVEVFPPITEVGLTEAPVRVGAVTVSVAVLAPLRFPVIVTEVLVVTGDVLAVKVAVFEPDATVTLAGTVAAAVLLLLRVTTFPPDGAVVLIVTVPVDVEPPLTDVGDKTTEERVCAFAATGMNIATRAKRKTLKKR
ncbi:MAG TPA: hypothetical protein VG944_07005 [Fimbriimonas sp.]|nr:hypothetical protein [Fimbriimonas sp.]